MMSRPLAYVTASAAAGGVLLLVFVLWWADRSGVTIELYPKARTECYQGPGRRELAAFELYSGGPGLRITCQRTIHLKLSSPSR